LASTFGCLLFNFVYGASLWARKKLENAGKGPVLSPASNWRTKLT